MQLPTVLVDVEHKPALRVHAPVAVVHASIVIGGASGGWTRSTASARKARLRAVAMEPVRFPALALSITNDELMTLRGTDASVSLYEAAPRAIERIAPGDAKARRIGHFEFFREQFSKNLRPRVIESVEELSTLENVRLGRSSA